MQCYIQTSVRKFFQPFLGQEFKPFFYHYLLQNLYEPNHEKTCLGFPTRSDTSQAVQPHKMPRGLKFQFKKDRELYYPCSEKQRR